MKINVDLYGGKGIFGGKETPLEADEIFCDKYDKCSFYKDNKCLGCRSFLSPRCRYGKNNVIKGYTSKAAKYYDFKKKYTQDDVYNKLTYPNEIVAVIDNELYMNLKYTLVRKENNNNRTNSWYEKRFNDYVISDVGFSKGDLWLPLDEITTEFLDVIFSYSPQAMMGGTITDYKEKVVPDIIQTMKKVYPELYSKLIHDYPKYNVEPNYVGKYAYIKTMAEGSVLTDCHGNEFTLKDESLICENMTRGFVPFNGESAKVVVCIKDKQKYKITDNSQVDDNTRFE